MSGRIGILAGGGALPLELAGVLAAQGRPYHIVAIDGFADAGVARHPHTRVGLGQLGGLLAALRSNGCDDLVIIGTLARPDLLRLRFDFGALRHARDVLALTRGGDDSLLRKVVRFFEGQGFTVRGVADVAPELIAPVGHIAGPQLDATAIRAVDVGRAALTALAAFDVGQAVVATPDGIVAFEDASGTARMLARCAMAVTGEPGSGPRVLVKLPKAGQEMRIDLPTIGTATVAQARGAGISAIVVAAGATQLADRSALATACEREGIGLFGIDAAAVQAGAAPPTRAMRRTATDAAQTTELVAALVRHTRPGIEDLGVVVRDGYVQAILIDGLAGARWPDRIAQIPAGWWGSLRQRRAGHLVLAVRPDLGADRTSADAVRDIARTAEQARFASLEIVPLTTDGSQSERAGEATCAAFVEAARGAVRKLTVTLGTGPAMIRSGPA